jgi:uncharacterized integral membrane protein
MRKILLILGILIFVDTCYFSFANIGQIVTAKYPPFLQYQWDIGAAYLAMAIYGALGAFAITYYYLLGIKNQLKRKSRNAEKSDIKAEECSDKIKTLEAKVNTLETALKEALSKK